MNDYSGRAALLSATITVVARGGLRSVSYTHLDVYKRQGVTTSFAVTGSLGVPLGFLLIAVILTLFAVGYTAMGRYVTNAGAFYAYVSQGLGRVAGVGGSLVALVSYNAMQIGIYGLFGFQLSIFLEAKLGFASPWWVWVLLCAVVVGVLGVCLLYTSRCV